MRYHRFDFPDLPLEAFKHYGDRRIKPQGGGGGGFVSEFIGNPLGTTIDTVSNVVNGASQTVANIGQGVSDIVANVGEGVSNTLANVGQGVSDVIHDVGTTVAKSPILSTAAAAVLIANGVAPSVAVGLVSANAGAPPEIVARNMILAGVTAEVANQVSSEVSGMSGGETSSTPPSGIESLPTTPSPASPPTVDPFYEYIPAPPSGIESLPSAPPPLQPLESAPPFPDQTVTSVEAPPPAEPITAPVESTPAPSTPVETVDTGPFVQSDNGLYTLPEEAVSTAPTTDLPEPPEEWTPPENLPPADTPTGIDAEGAQPPISTDQTDEIYKKLNSVKKQIANDLVKKGIPLSSAVQYANGLGQTSLPSTQIIQQPQQTTSGGTTLSPLSPQYLTSTANKQGFVNPLSTYQKMVASDTAPLQQNPVQPQDTVQVSQGNVMPDYYSYGQNQSIDDILGITAKEGGLITPLMAKGGSVQKYAEGGLSVPMMNYGGKMRGDFRHGAHVAGPGDGQSDDIPAMLADGEYVLDSEIVAALGNGSTKAGSKLLDKFRQEIRAHKRSGSINSIPPKSKSPLQYLADAKKKMDKK